MHSSAAADARRSPSASPLLHHRMDSRSAKTVRVVMVHQPDRLHQGIDNDGADDFNPALLQRLRDFLGKRGLRKDLAAVPDGGAAHHIPDEGGEILAGVAHGEVGPGTADRRLDLRARAHDAGVVEQLDDVGFSESRHSFRIEILESFSEGIALAQNGQPGQTGLKAVQHQFFPERATVVFRDTPFFVVIGAKKRIAFCPGAAMRRFGAHRYTATVPPSTGRSTPVMMLLSSDARNRTAAAISSGRPIRCIGVMAMNRSFIAPTFGPNWASRSGVSIGPGLTMLARMPLPASSAVHVRTNERKAAFVALYVEYIGIPFCQAPQPLTMIEPPSFIRGRAFCTVKKTPRPFTPKVFS